MARRTKQLVRNRAKSHQKVVHAGHKRRVRAKSRGLKSSAKRRKLRGLKRRRR